MNSDTEFDRRPSLILGAGLGVLTSLPLIGILYLGARALDLPFVPFDLFDLLARVLPGNVITIGIDSMVNVITRLGLGPISGTAKSLEQAQGIVLLIVAGGAFGLVLALVNRRSHLSGSTNGVLLGLMAFILLAAVEIRLGSAIASNPLGALSWLAILFVGWGALLGRWLDAPQLSTVTPPPIRGQAPEIYLSRRAMLIRLAGGSVAVAVAATGLGKLLEIRQQAIGAGQPISNLNAPIPPTPSSPTAVTPAPIATPPAAATEILRATARDRVSPAPGTRLELTPTKDFYRIDIDTIPPLLDKTTWKLQVKGLFNHPRDLQLSDLLAYPPVTQPITQSCISNPVGGDLISTTNYIGVRVREVLTDLGLRPEARALYIQAADGFYETVGIQDLMDVRTLLVYGMNGDTLPTEHGFPLRIYIPNRYGMKQPKWITSIEAIDHTASGYWVDRGWSPTAFPQIVSVVDTVATDHIENGQVPVGGIAWAGDRGIQKVQVQVDGGNWEDAVLRTPPLGPLTWIQWRYDWPLVRGSHTFTVRATDGTGAQQIEEAQDTYPNGATGYHSVTVAL